MNVKETGCKIVDWIHLAQDRVLVNTAINLPSSTKTGTF